MLAGVLAVVFLVLAHWTAASFDHGTTGLGAWEEGVMERYSTPFSATKLCLSALNGAPRLVLALVAQMPCMLEPQVP